ncbi:MAG: peptidylprolyl isomerase [Marinilabiliales bacterium]|nr:MAG: peptidylprolyl isomerase [Marinilabiliales bacterium]
MSKKVEVNDKIKVHYKGTLNDGQVFDTSEGKEPLEFQVGQGQLIKGFEDAVLGMGLEETKTVTISSDEAYGPVHDQLVKELMKKDLPEDIDPFVGQQLVAKQNEQEIIFRVIEVADETFKVDANHPLAGKDLTFEITIVEIAA